jgi:hypothetical protein
MSVIPPRHVLRSTLAPLIAGAVLTAAHPNLPFDAIQIDQLHSGSRELGLGLRFFLYRPDADLLRRWSAAIGAHGGSHVETSVPDEVRTTVHGAVDGTPVELVCVLLATPVRLAELPELAVL